jgi:2-polyprenyl-3-methyl-5-hydroxy-6-metoxy-1,4-benzoquinol methylase
MIPPGKTRYIGAANPNAAPFERLVAEYFNLTTAKPGFLERVSKWASLSAYNAWRTAYQKNAGTFLDHAVWGADRDLGGGQFLYGAMDDRYATNAARVFVPHGLNALKHVKDKKVCVVGAWDGTECLLLRALGAEKVDAIEEVPVFCEMARAQYETWNVPGWVYAKSLYEINIETMWQQYDLIYVPGVLYHLTDLPAALTMLWAMLKPAGVLAFESCADPKGSNSARYIGASVPGWNWWCPTPECFEAMMRDCGFPDARTVEHAAGRGWWMGTRAEFMPVLASGAAGFSRPDVLRTIARLCAR